MSLRIKLAILCSVMTIPMLAENDNSLIEDKHFDVQIKIPEGWTETKDFDIIPDTFECGGIVFHGVQFKNGAERDGCAVFFAAEKDKVTSDDAIVQAHAQAQELAFPGAKISSFTISNAAILETRKTMNRFTKVNINGTVEGCLSRPSGNPSYLTVTGNIEGDTKSPFALGTCKIASNNNLVSGTTGVLLTDNYQLIMFIWGTDEATQQTEALRFLKAMTVTAKVPSEPVAAQSEPIVVVEAVVADVAQTKPKAPAKSVPVAADAAQTKPADSTIRTAIPEAAVKAASKTSKSPSAA
jgi:hypothetical protein